MEAIVMARLRMMRAPQKYVQGRDALFKFYDEMKDFTCIQLLQLVSPMPHRNQALGSILLSVYYMLYGFQA